ncbi:MAG: chemotaxis protein CheC [ANME-2 cluster archaeon]|jgi:chemotaxis protein CheC|nr:chemotaxis protein CheC [ANME-2 cluster archaeon]
MNQKLSDVEKLHQIKKIGDASATQAMVSLTELLGTDVEMDVTSANLISIYSIPQIVGNEEMVGLYSNFSGTISGSMLFLLTTDSVKELSNVMLADFADEDTDEMFTEMQKSVVIEIGNIVASSFVDTWANTFSIELSHNTPIFGYDFADSFIDHALIKAANNGDFVIMFKNKFCVVGMDINFTILMFPDPDKLQNIFDMF